MSLFKKSKRQEVPVPTSPTKYPSGVCVVTESGRYYLKDGRKYLIRSNAIFESWNFPLVVASSDAAISEYRKSIRPLGFRDGTVVRNLFNSELFIISNSKKVKIVDPELFKQLGLDDTSIPYVSPEDIGLHVEGEIE